MSNKKKKFHPARFKIKMHNKYFCDDGYVAHSLSDAKKHGYEYEARCYGYELESIIPDKLPIARNFGMEHTKDGDYNRLTFTIKGKAFYNLPCANWLIKEAIKDRQPINLTGTIENPFDELDQGYEVLIYDIGSWTIIADCDDVGSPYTFAFRVDKEEYHKALDEFNKKLSRNWS